MDNKKLEKILSDIISVVGVPANIKGYKYLREAIFHVVKNNKLASSITKTLYPLVAEENSTSASKVERNIRHAIEVGYNSGRLVNINKIFDAEIFQPYYKPTNSEFIMLIADRMNFAF